MVTRIKITQWPVAIENKRSTILEAALKNGIPYPHSCRTGECGNCKTRLLVGEIKHDPYFDEALSDAEREQGLILACRARPQTEVEVAWLKEVDLSASYQLRKVKATIISLDRVTHNIMQLRLRTNGSPVAFAAGQYARLKFGKLPARSFSMANRPDEELLEFHIRHLPDGQVSNHIAETSKVGDTVQFEGPFGDSYLRDKHQGPILAVAGGTGLAPILSIIRTAIASSSQRPIKLYFGIQDEHDIYAGQLLTQLQQDYPGFDYQIVLSAPAATTQRRTGFVHQALLEDIKRLGNLNTYNNYIAGPSIMVGAVNDLLIEHGAVNNTIYTDPFTPSAVDETTTGSKVLGVFTGLLRKRSSTPATA